jgi:hypothetical protein
MPRTTAPPSERTGRSGVTDGAPVTSTRTEAAVLDALQEHPNATVRALYQAAGVGYSTAGKALAAMETRGLVQRTPGRNSHGHREPDTWSPAPSTASTGREPAPSAAAGPGHRRTGRHRPPAQVGAAAPARPTPAADAPTETPTETAVTPAPAAPRNGGGRLRRGQLHEMVLEFLNARPGCVLTPYQIGRTLVPPRSVGAVGNALKALAARDEVTHVADAPRRYQARTRK